MRTCPDCSSPCDATHRFCPSCGARVRTAPKAGHDPWIGTTLPGGYIIQESIGIGGMGTVYRAEQTALGRTVAVKVVHPHLLADETTEARFITEARAASRLNHPNSLAVIDFGKTERGQLYLVTEYLRGRDLARLVSEEGLLPFSRIINIIHQLLDALSEAHHLGIIHRDLKPSNIVVEPMRTTGDFVKVVDFGLAKILNQGDGGAAVTVAGGFYGTVEYMAPEQARGDPPDARSDLYAVGVILFRLLTGRLPFESASPVQVLVMHRNEPPPDPREVAPERQIPDVLVDITLRALAKDPQDRFQSAEEFAQALVEAQLILEPPPVSISSDFQGLTTIRCASCGDLIPNNNKFCGQCGAPISLRSTTRPGGPISSVPVSARARTRGSRPHGTTLFPLPLQSRNEDLSWLHERLNQPQETSFAARLVGEPGVGKTRLLREFAAQCQAEGHHVVQVGPDPWGSRVSYYALRSVVRQLTGLPPDGGLPKLWGDVPPPVYTGLINLFSKPEGSASPQELRPQDCRFAVAEVLRWALVGASERAVGRRVLVLIDDLEHIDGASGNAFADVVNAPLVGAVLFLGTHVPGAPYQWSSSYPARMLLGLGRSEAAALLQSTPAADIILESSSRSLLPMYVEQLGRFIIEGGSAPPAGLGDLVALRVARLKAEQRRVLQATAVLGEEARLDQIIQLVGSSTDVQRGTAALVQAGFLCTTEQGVRFAHPLIREIAEVAIPAAVSKQLHSAAANLSVGAPVPIEARAHYILGAEDAFDALLLLDQVGDRALYRDDVKGAIEAFTRGRDFARLQTGGDMLHDPMSAVLIFTRKLGEALSRAGQNDQAHELLREALELAKAPTPERAKVLFALSKVALAREGGPKAFWYLKEAISVAQRAEAFDLVQTFKEAGRAWTV